MSKERHVFRGLVAGVAGGLAASWVMNEFIAGPGPGVASAVNRATGANQPEPPSTGDERDSTMKVADTLTEIATGGRHLTLEQQKKGGPIVHYGFGALMGGLYGALAEVMPSVKAGFGTTFASALFTGADIIAVPTLKLGKPADEQKPGALAEYYLAHVVYGASTELVRRLIRAAL